MTQKHPERAGKNWERNQATKRASYMKWLGVPDLAAWVLLREGWLVARLQRRIHYWKRKSAAQHRVIARYKSERNYYRQLLAEGCARLEGLGAERDHYRLALVLKSKVPNE